MELRRRTSQVLAGAGAVLMVAGLSLGGGVAVAVPGPAAQPPADVARATTTSSDSKSSDNKSSGNKSSDRKSSKGRKSRNDTSGTDSTGGNGGSTDSTGGNGGSTDSTGSNRSTDSTSPTPTTTTPTTTPPSTTATTRPTATTAPPTSSTDPATTETTPAEPNGQYNGGPPPYQATEAPADDSTSTTTIPPGRAAKAPANRSGSGQPPEIRLFDPGNKPANSSPAPATLPDATTPAGAQPAPVATAESRPSQPTGSPAAAGGSSEPATAPSPASEVSGAETERRDAGAARRSRQLGQTGDGTRRLIIFGGIAMLLGAVVVAFTSREGPALAAASLPVGPARRPRPRKEIDGWEDGIPHAPTKRELARNRLGISADSYDGDELEV